MTDTDKADSIPHLRALAEAAPHKSRPWLRLAKALATDGDIDGEIEALMRRLEVGAENPDIRARLAQRLTSLGRNSEAVPHLRALAETKPQDGAAWLRLARALASTGDSDGETAALQRRLECGPDDMAVRARLVQRLTKLNREAEALPHLRVLAENEPQDGTVWLRYARVLARTGDSEGEIMALQRRLESGPDDMAIRNRLVERLTRLGREDDAIPHLRVLAEANPHDIAPWQRFALALAKLGDTEGAIEALQWRLKVGGEAPELRARLAQLMARRDRESEALSQMKTLAKAEPTANERVGGFCNVRDGVDILPLICGHYLRLGFSRLLFFDDKSADGSFQFLQELSRRDPRVSVEAIDIVSHEHGLEIKGEAIKRLLSEGINIVLPFDHDEFWNVDLRSLRAACRTSLDGVIQGMLIQFVQSAKAVRFKLSGLWSVKYRAPALAPSSSWAVKQNKPYLCFAKAKVGFKSGTPIKMGPGNHSLAAGPEHVVASQLEVFHLPLRSKTELTKRARYPFSNAHFRNWNTEEGRTEAWRALSADQDGCLNAASGEKFVLLPDVRLRKILIRAWIYMALRHPILLARGAHMARKYAQRLASEGT